MKKILTMTFTSVDAFRKVRDLIEQSPKPMPVWKYGNKGTGHYIEFYHGTKPEFFVGLGADMITQKITGWEINGAAEAARENGAGKSGGV